MNLLVAFLIFLLIVCVIAAIVAFVLSKIPGVPPWAANVVWAVAGLLVLIWILEHLSTLTHIAS